MLEESISCSDRIVLAEHRESRVCRVADTDVYFFLHQNGATEQRDRSAPSVQKARRWIAFQRQGWINPVLPKPQADFGKSQADEFEQYKQE
jgi:hypothetical protein